MKISMIRAVALLAGVGLSGLASAEPSKIAWTYVEAAWQQTEFSGEDGFPDVDGDGGLFAGSLAMGDYFHVMGKYQVNSLDTVTLGSQMVDLGDLNIWGVGVGVHTPISSGDPKRPLVARYSAFVDAQYLSTDADVGSDADGFAFDAGVRLINFTSFEFIGSVGYEKFEGIDGEVGLKARLLYRLVDNLQVQGGLSWNDNTTQWLLGVRYNFPGARIF